MPRMNNINQNAQNNIVVNEEQYLPQPEEINYGRAQGEYVAGYNDINQYFIGGPNNPLNPEEYQIPYPINAPQPPAPNHWVGQGDGLWQQVPEPAPPYPGMPFPEDAPAATRDSRTFEPEVWGEIQKLILDNIDLKKRITALENKS